jgi:hypothetical protein
MLAAAYEVRGGEDRGHRGIPRRSGGISTQLRLARGSSDNPERDPNRMLADLDLVDKCAVDVGAARTLDSFRLNRVRHPANLVCLQ